MLDDGAVGFLRIPSILLKIAGIEHGIEEI
jgi:hypothetical protein